MDWITINSADLECALNKPQLETLKAECLKSAGHDILQDIISSVVSRIRAEITSGPSTKLSAEHSKIPHELKDCALSLALEMLQVRIPDIQMPESIQRRADEARRTLLRVAEGSLRVSSPIYGVSGACKKSLYAKSNRIPNFSANSMEGL